MPPVTTRTLRLVAVDERGDCEQCDTEPTPANPVYRDVEGLDGQIHERLCRSCLDCLLPIEAGQVVVFPAVP